MTGYQSRPGGSWVDGVSKILAADGNRWEANQQNAFDRANHSGTQSADTIVDGSTNHAFTAADDTKLAGIAAGANVGVATVQDEGTPVTARTAINFIGTGVAVADDSANSRTNVTITGGGGGGVTVQDEGSNVTSRTTVNFTGGGVTAADNSGSARTDVTIPGVTVQDEGSGLTQRSIINFAGAGVTAADDAANSRTNVTITSSGYTTVAEEGAGLTQRTTLNFIGRNVTAGDNSGSTRTDVTVQDTAAVHAVGNSGTSLTVDVTATAGPAKTITLTGNCTFTFTSPPGSRLWVMDLLLTQDATGGRTVTWPASVKWSGGAPTLSTAASAKDWLVFATWDGGTTWLGMVVGRAFA